MRRSVFFVLLTLLALSVPGARAAGRGEPGPVVEARVELGNELADLKALLDLDIDVDGVFDGWARVHVLEEEVVKLRRLGFEITLHPEGIPGPGPSPGPAQVGIDVPAVYHTYATLTADLHQIADDHPEIVRLASIGKTVQDRDLWMMKISRFPDLEEDEPEFLYIAAMHGDEVVGKELCVNLINHLTDNYGTDSRVTDLVDSTEIWILPSMNPDGTHARRRYNSNSVDLNRNFPDQFVDPVNTPDGREPETGAVMNWRAAHSPVLSGNFHGGALVVNYPRDGNEDGLSVYTAATDDSTLVSVSRTYADNNPPLSASNGHPAWNNGITNGADWYAINRGMQDWQYVWHGGVDLTLEVSTEKWPAASALPGFWADNQESMLAHMERVHEGVRGLVTDASTGAPLAASVRFDGNPFPSYADPDVGDYHRVLLPGRYVMEVSATGYSSKVLEVVVAAGPAVRYDVALEPLDVDLQPAGACVDDVENCRSWLLPGEAADLEVTLRNLGLPATAVASRLEPTGWFITVTRAGADYPDIDTGQEGASLPPHHGVEVSPSVPTGHQAGFAVHWTSAEGAGVSGPFFLPVDDPTCLTVDSSDVPQAIQDRSTATSVVSFPDPLRVYEVKVTVDITHTYRGELRVEVVSPSGTPVALHNRSGGSADDILGTYPDTLTPFEPLDRLDGEPSGGTWELRINDGSAGDEGTLNAWSLEVCGRPEEDATPEMRFRDLRLEDGAVILHWWPYPGLTSYRVYRSVGDPSVSAFLDVTGEDPDDSDTVFRDPTADPLIFWLVTGVGPAGEGPLH